jgi:putative transcriptional regulator
MTKKTIEERLIASAKEALAIKRGELVPPQAYDLPLTTRHASAAPAPVYTKDQIAKIRSSLGLSQALFAEALNVSLGTVRSWEQGVRYPDGAASRLLQVVERMPTALSSFVREKSPRPARERASGEIKHRSGDIKHRSENSFTHTRDVPGGARAVNKFTSERDKFTRGHGKFTGHSKTTGTRGGSRKK